VRHDARAQQVPDQGEEGVKELAGAVGQLEHLWGGGELASERTGHRAGVGVDEVAHEVGEDRPAVVSGLDPLDGGLGLVADDDQAVRAQRAEEFLLAAVAGVQRADADAGVLGHRGDRCAGVGHEHRPGRFEYAPVVAGRLGLAAAERAVVVAAWLCLGHGEKCSRRLEQTIPF
jgi:hypothetical protein